MLLQEMFMPVEKITMAKLSDAFAAFKQSDTWKELKDNLGERPPTMEE